MKIAPRQIDSFIKSPDKNVRVFVLYGPNNGLIKERSQALAKKFVPDLNDPFNVISFTSATINEDPARFRDETASLSLMGGTRLLFVKEAADNISLYIKEYCENPSDDCIIILEAGDLKPSSPLRKLAEQSEKAASIACYLNEERDVISKIRDMCQHAGYAMDQDALRIITESLAGDSALLHQEVTKLLLYKGYAEGYEGLDGQPIRQKIGTISLNDIFACNPNMRDYSLDDLINAAASGNTQKAHQMTEKIMSEGIPAIVIFRAFLRHFRRLYSVICLLSEGESEQKAIGSLRPPVFFKYKQEFAQQTRLWKKQALEAVIDKITDDEATSKTGGINGDLLCLHLTLNISRMASAYRR